MTVWFHAIGLLLYCERLQYKLFSSEICGIFKNTFLFEHPWADVFDIIFDELIKANTQNLLFY